VTRQYPSSMAVLGLDAAGEQLYRTSLRNAGARRQALAEKLGWPLDRVTAGLTKLDALGLIDLDGDEVRTVSPDQAVERLIATESRRLA